MKLSEKLKIYSGFCTAFLQSIFNLKLFKQKMSLIDSSEIIDCEIRALLMEMSKESVFSTP